MSRDRRLDHMSSFTSKCVGTCTLQRPAMKELLVRELLDMLLQ